ncbi:MAG: hypothetical protein AAF098_17590 [Pseudomonadota bacterium]
MQLFPQRPLRYASTLCTLLMGVTPAVMSQSSSEESKSTYKTAWSGELGIGGEYDTNVTVSEVDLSSGESDYAFTSDFELGAKRQITESLKASASYSINQSRYREFSRVDRLTQIAGVNIEKGLGSASSGLSVYYIDSKLSGDGFLELLRVSPALSGFLAKRWFLRGAYVFSERTIDDRNERDATTHTAEFDAYYFHRGLRSYVNIGARYRDEDTGAPELDFSGAALKARYIRRFKVLEKQAKFEVAFRYEERDYRSPEPTIDEKRKDDRIRWKLDFELPLTEQISWQAYYSYGDFESNLPRADFVQTIVGSRLQFAW